MSSNEKGLIFLIVLLQLVSLLGKWKTKSTFLDKIKPSLVCLVLSAQFSEQAGVVDVEGVGRKQMTFFF